jgi:hypothetical protein
MFRVAQEYNRILYLESEVEIRSTSFRIVTLAARNPQADLDLRLSCGTSFQIALTHSPHDLGRQACTHHRDHL